MVGTVFITHGPVSDFTVETLSDAASYLPRLTSSFDITDEFYVCERRTEAELRAFQEGLWQFERHPMGYVRDYGQGCVLYTALGHDERAFNHPDFQDLIFKGLRYVMGQEQEETIRVCLLGYGPAFGMGTRTRSRSPKRRGWNWRPSAIGIPPVWMRPRRSRESTWPRSRTPARWRAAASSVWAS